MSIHQCIGKSYQKRIDITYYNEEYQHAIARVKSQYGRHLKAKRSATVEPVIGTLTQFMGLRKINIRGIHNANKCMLSAATAYNLKTYLKFTKNKTESMAQSAEKHFFELFDQIPLIFCPNPGLNF